MNASLLNPGLYWRPLGGNNIDQISGHCYQYTCIYQHLKQNLKKTSIIIDLGKFDNHQALGIKNSVAAVPDIRNLLTDETLNLKAIFITHSHPDHLNGIVHYIRAGYKLPTIYGGKYTKMILDNLYEYYQIGKILRPTFVVINDGDCFKFGKMKIEAISASHTSFDCFGFIIADGETTIYHSGDMKVDQTTYFRKPTNLKRIAELADSIDYTVADFCGIDNDGFAFREADVLKCLVKIIKKSQKKKIFFPVYPTHADMYILAFLTALKLRKNVIFFGNEDFYDYLKQMNRYGINFAKMAQGKIKLLFAPSPEMDELGDDYMVIGVFNDIGNIFNANSRDSFALITAKTFFNPLKGQMNARNIKFVTIKDYPILQGAGHGFVEDWNKIAAIMPHATFIPTHCPCFVAESFRPLADFLGIKLINPIPKNNYLYKLEKNQYTLLKKQPAVWMVAKDDLALAEVWQKATSGIGFLKRTFSRRRTVQKFEMMLCKRRK